MVQEWRRRRCVDAAPVHVSRARNAEVDIWYLTASPELLAITREKLERLGSSA